MAAESGWGLQSGMVRLTVWAWLASLAACLSLGPLVTGVGFFAAGAFAGGLVVAVAAVGRHQRAPVALVLVVQLFVLLEWATLSYAAEEAWGGLLPTKESLLALVDLVRSALDTAEQYAPPAPGYEGVDMSLALVIAAVVLIVDVVTVTWRRPALVGLIFLGVYMAPVSLLAGDVPLTAFVPGALAFVFLLGAEQRDRLTHWGRQVGITSSLLSDRDRDRVRVATLVQSGRRVGLSAVALAVVIPLLVPTLPRIFLAEGPLTGGEGSGLGGDGGVDIENPMLDLRRNLGDRTETVLVTMTTTGTAPSYLRIASLDTFTGTTWQPGPRTDETVVPVGEAPQAPGLTTAVSRSQFTSTVSLTESFRTTWLPTFYPTTDLRVSGEWGIDLAELDVSAREVGLNGAGTTYQMSSAMVLPTEEELRAAPAPTNDMSRYLDLPEISPEINALAERVTAGTATAFGQAEALQAWFRTEGGFEYSLESGADDGDGAEAIQNFLVAERVGYCEQFAAAMALMARSLDIPARVAVGFLQAQEAAEGTWAFRGVDMHAWPELYFEGIGWVRFEPTPAARTGPAPSFDPLQDEPSPTDNFGDPETPAPSESLQTPRPDGAAGAAGGSDGDGPGPLLPVAAIALVLLLTIGPRSLRAARRARRWRLVRASRRPVAEAAWAELTDVAVDLGVRVDRDATLRTTGRGLRSRVDGDSAAVSALNRLVVDVERSRFARGGAAGGRTVADTGRDVDLVARRLSAGCSTAQRWRAAWLPASLLPRRPRDGWAWSGQRATGSGMLLQADDQPRG